MLPVEFFAVFTGTVTLVLQGSLIAILGAGAVIVGSLGAGASTGLRALHLPQGYATAPSAVEWPAPLECSLGTTR